MVSSVVGIGITGTELTDTERRILRETPPAGVVLFGRNVGSIDQLRALVKDIRAEATAPQLIMIDLEGGRVDRLRTLFPGLPGAARVGESPDSDRLARELGDVIGSILRFFDIDVDFAPVVDVRRDWPVPGLERRMFGSDPQRVTTLAREFLHGLHARGVAGCLKHFPGMGSGTADPHYGESAFSLSRKELDEIDLVPYAQLANECGAVMIGHGTYSNLEGPDIPASINSAIIRGILRKELGFDGVVISDDMEMHAVADLESFSDSAEHGLVAGNDIVIYCAQSEAMPKLIDTLGRRADSNPALRARVADAIERINRYRAHIESLRRNADVLARPAIESRLAELRRETEMRRQDDIDFETGKAGTGRTGREEWT